MRLERRQGFGSAEEYLKAAKVRLALPPKAG